METINFLEHCFAGQEIALICDGQTGVIACPSGTHVHVVQAAYGRSVNSSILSCLATPTSLDDNMKCLIDMTEQAQYTCLKANKSICQLHMEKLLLGSSDPCAAYSLGFAKYLNLTYICSV